MSNPNWCAQYQNLYYDDADYNRDIRERMSQNAHEKIPTKLIFHFRLKGLEYGGLVENWGVYDGGKPLSHRASIIPNHCAIAIYPTEIRAGAFNKGTHHKQLHLDHDFSGVVTDVVTMHYPDDYVVATKTHYYVLGERKLTHDNIRLVETRRHFDGSHIYRLVDYGDCRDSVITVAMQCQVTHLDYMNSVEVMYEIRVNLLRAYRDELRRGV
jgi:hypothetical protein